MRVRVQFENVGFKTAGVLFTAQLTYVIDNFYKQKDNSKG